MPKPKPLSFDVRIWCNRCNSVIGEVKDVLAGRNIDFALREHENTAAEAHARAETAAESGFYVNCTCRWESEWYADLSDATEAAQGHAAEAAAKDDGVTHRTVVGHSGGRLRERR